MAAKKLPPFLASIIPAGLNRTEAAKSVYATPGAADKPVMPFSMAATGVMSNCMRKLLVSTCVSGVETHVPADSKHPGGNETAFTVRVAGMLTTMPALLLTRTVNCDPLSEVAVNAVVYREEVAPMMGEPFLLHC
jgi:hypothetical protein